MSDNPLIQGHMQNLGSKPDSTSSAPEMTKEEFIEMAKQGGVKYAGGALPDFLKGIVSDAKDVDPAPTGGVIGDVQVSEITLNVLGGIQTLDEVQEPEKATVTSELDQLGFNSDVAPEWFIEASTAENISPEEVEATWNETRNEIIEQPLDIESNGIPQ